MAIDYIINKDCEVKEEVGSAGLIQLIKSRNRAAEIFLSLIEEGKSESEALQTSFSVQLYASKTGESEVKKVTVRDLFRETSQLKELALHCESCPINSGEGFGCYNTVSYPISTEAEKWISQLGQLAVVKGLPESILLKFILDEEVTGEFFAKMRRDIKSTFLQYPEPLEILVEKKLLKRTKVNTNQILDMLFAIGTMERTHQMLLLFFSSGVTISHKEPDPEFLLGNIQAAAVKGESGELRYWIFNLPPIPSDDVSITQIKRFFRSVFAGFAIGETLSVDY